ncbi:uncharacterized protein LACBIDRAFT_330575 [Laccaria bicolor S238N-H82]|uniref:Predicted protein n=1 Tax=Laccaria bicolor (strain S238N-H82 / ATCC MYA-4686) TaxID=486041 RepID=B0DLR8_LACBS|nr:uncharacterized protein LACBIDRAFT_330575 [Laccaria bicolor S238N-H82]EDR04441.1 predicted protein [Laccaria bicolor S238N-H82]|eukprot:XP_001884960.1 predicted protein [Laccaria bicolor S238N-H82]
MEGRSGHASPDASRSVRRGRILKRTWGGEYHVPVHLKLQRTASTSIPCPNASGGFGRGHPSITESLLHDASTTPNWFDGGYCGFAVDAHKRNDGQESARATLTLFKKHHGKPQKHSSDARAAVTCTRVAATRGNTTARQGQGKVKACGQKTFQVSTPLRLVLVVAFYFGGHRFSEARAFMGMDDTRSVKKHALTAHRSKNSETPLEEERRGLRRSSCFFVASLETSKPTVTELQSSDADQAIVRTLHIKGYRMQDFLDTLKRCSSLVNLVLNEQDCIEHEPTTTPLTVVKPDSLKSLYVNALDENCFEDLDVFFPEISQGSFKSFRTLVFRSSCAETITRFSFIGYIFSEEEMVSFLLGLPHLSELVLYNSKQAPPFSNIFIDALHSRAGCTDSESFLLPNL